MENHKSRVNKIKEIENNLKSSVITLIYNTSNTRFKTQLASDVIPSLNELLKTIQTKRGEGTVTLVLHSSGGFIDVIGSFIYLLRKKFSKFNVAIPAIAHSAATLLCLGSDTILMNDLSSLSPVDPQIMLRTQSGSIGASAEDIKGYYSLIDSMFKDDSAKIQAFIALLNRFPAEILGHMERIQKQTEMVATKALQYQLKDKKKIKEIVNKIQRDFYSHDYRIHYEEAKKVGVKVQMMNDKIETLCYDLLSLYEKSFGGQSDLEIEIPENETSKEIIIRRAYLECANCSFSYKTRYRVFKDKKVEVDELGWSKN
ncbi:MAG TPA: hypothetical protein PLX02_07140 [Syntrophorhabdaceae bacterium]|nr:hypothetical protein [Syntrophorhabdaceae bacterium]HQM81380.1 hypothetical protein [Syntrophorhabdaceae bacterium]